MFHFTTDVAPVFLLLSFIQNFDFYWDHMKRSRVNDPLAFFRFPDSTEFQKKKSRIRHTTKLILKKKKFNCSYFEYIMLILSYLWFVRNHTCCYCCCCCYYLFSSFSAFGLTRSLGHRSCLSEWVSEWASKWASERKTLYAAQHRVLAREVGVRYHGRTTTRGIKSNWEVSATVVTTRANGETFFFFTVFMVF